MADDDDDDDDFAAMFADFESSGESLSLLSEKISNNLRAAAGLSGTTVVHEGDVDEGNITWEAPQQSGLQNPALPTTGAEEAEDALWAELAGDDDEDTPKMQLSENLLGGAKEAVKSMPTEALEETAAVFDKLAAHGKGFAVLDIQEFQQLMMKLAKDEQGKKLLKLLLSVAG